MPRAGRKGLTPRFAAFCAEGLPGSEGGPGDAALGVRPAFEFAIAIALSHRSGCLAIGGALPILRRSGENGYWAAIS